MTLIEILKEKEIKTDKHYTVFEQSQHTYLDVYDEIFKPYKEEKISVCEIGILIGESLKLWHEYFTNAKIYGADIFGRCPFEEVKRNVESYDRVSLHRVDSFSDNLFEIENRNKFFNSLPNNQLDIIIDDGSHELVDQVKTFEIFSKVLSKDGLYVIEDIGITNDREFDSYEIGNYIPGLKMIDMRHLGYHDNFIAIYYRQDSKHAEYLDGYIKSEKWKTITK